MNPYFTNLETKTKKGRLLNRLFHYFQFQEGINFSEKNKPYPSKVDFIYIDSNYLKENKIQLNEIVTIANNDTCIIFENPHYSKVTESQWELVVSNIKFNVTIDTYSFGLAFIRKEQVKEHFTIRV